MGTVDVKLPEETLGGLVSLKFWVRGPHSGEYSLSTVIYEPHSDSGISALAFRPNHEMAATSSFGGDFKVWVCGSSTDDQIHKNGWRCQSFGSYKGRPMTAATFSADGSVLAIAAETFITLWDPDTNVLIAVIGDTLSPIMALSFIGKSNFLVSLSQGSMPQLAVWNTSKLSFYWSYKLTAEAVSSTCDGSQFAVLAHCCLADNDSVKGSNGVILLFDAENPHPLSTWIVKKAKGGGLAFLSSSKASMTESPKENGDSLLAYVNGDHEYVIFNPFSTGENQVGRKVGRKQFPAEEAVRYGYSSIYGDLPDFDLKKEQVSEISYFPTQRPWETLLKAPWRDLPPLTMLCTPFFQSLQKQ